MDRNYCGAVNQRRKISSIPLADGLGGTAGRVHFAVFSYPGGPASDIVIEK
jgi:hypothetical protein